MAPHEVRLAWDDPAEGAAGHIVEFATEPDGEWVIVAFCPGRLAEFTHERLAPATTFYYRVRAFAGPACEPIAVALPAELTDADYAARYAKPEDYDWAVPLRREKTPDVAQHALRDARDAELERAAPGDLRVELVPTTVSGFLLTWIDRAQRRGRFSVREGGR